MDYLGQHLLGQLLLQGEDVTALHGQLGPVLELHLPGDTVPRSLPSPKVPLLSSSARSVTSWTSAAGHRAGRGQPGSAGKEPWGCRLRARGWPCPGSVLHLLSQPGHPDTAGGPSGPPARPSQGPHSPQPIPPARRGVQRPRQPCLCAPHISLGQCRVPACRWPGECLVTQPAQGLGVPWLLGDTLRGSTMGSLPGCCSPPLWTPRVWLLSLKPRWHRGSALVSAHVFTRLCVAGWQCLGCCPLQQRGWGRRAP